MLFDLSRQISNEKTCQNISTISSCSVFSLKPKFTVLFQKYTLLLKAYKHCATDGSIIYAYFGVYHYFSPEILANRIFASPHSREIPNFLEVVSSRRRVFTRFPNFHSCCCNYTGCLKKPVYVVHHKRG